MDSFFEITKYDPKIDSEELLNEQIKIAYQTNKLFFGQDLTIGIDFLYSREEMDQITGRKTADWVVGRIHNGRVKIFSPSIFDKVSNHSASNFPLVLTHEITHIFTEQIYGFKFPVWFNEGLAGCVAGQYKNKEIKKDQIQDLNELHDYGFWNKNPNYNQAFLFTNFLIQNIGKEKILEFCSQLKEKESYEDFCKKFKNSFDEALDDYKKKWMQELD